MRLGHVGTGQGLPQFWSRPVMSGQVHVRSGHIISGQIKVGSGQVMSDQVR